MPVAIRSPMDAVAQSAFKPAQEQHAEHLTKMLSHFDEKDWVMKLPQLQWSLNNSFHTGILGIPYVAVFGQTPR